jgi:hypothetical protein
VREIAELARHHHRFVQGRFDGIAALYVEVLNEISGERASEVELRQVQGQLDKRVVQAVLLVAWLLANVPALVAGPTRDVFVVLSARPRLKIPRCSLAALSYAESQR